MDHVLPDWLPEEESLDGTDNDRVSEKEPCAVIPSESKIPLENLSLDLLAWLLSYLTVPEIAFTSLVSKRLHRACRSNGLWKLKFEGRWNISVDNPGQNWYRAYQEGYQNPHDLWISHWNCVYPQDGLVPGRCCIYDVPELSPQVKDGKERHDTCPSCRFFPEHPLSSIGATLDAHSDDDNNDPDREQLTTERIARATDRSLKKFCEHHKYASYSPKNYKRQRAKDAFSNAATFHRTIRTQQYTASHPNYQSDCTYSSPLKDLLFFNVTEEPMSTRQGALELEHLRRERDLRQQWEAEQTSRSRRSTDVFWKPGFETAHHSWHQALVSNPDFDRPLVFRISIQRPDCFTVFPSEGYLEPGKSIVITFGVRPLGSLMASAFESINVQRAEAEDWIQHVWDEEGPLPCVPFVLRYKYSSVIPCIPANGFIPPHLPSLLSHEEGANQSENDHEQENTEDNSANPFPSVAEVCWKQKQLVDYHWSGGDSTTFVESHEVRNIYLSAHVNANYPFFRFCGDTLTPFDIPIGPETSTVNIPMLYYAAPQLREFYPTSVYSLLQNAELETEVSHAGQVFRSHRRRCSRCHRSGWGPRLEEMGQAYVLAQLDFVMRQEEQTRLLQNCVLILRFLHSWWREFSFDVNNLGEKSNQDLLIRAQQLIYNIHNMLERYRAAPYFGRKQRQILTMLEVLTDWLYGELSEKIQVDTERIFWRRPGIYRYRRSTDSVFSRQHLVLNDRRLRSVQIIKSEPKSLEAFRFLAHTPGRFNMGPQEDPNHLGEPTAVCASAARYSRRQKGVVTDMFMDDPLCSLESALVMLQNPRCLSVHGIYDRVPYPGKVVRRPRFPLWVSDIAGYNMDGSMSNYSSSATGKEVYYALQDTIDVGSLLQPSLNAFLWPTSLRRYLRNVPAPGMGRFPLSIDQDNDGMADEERHAKEGSDVKSDSENGGSGEQRGIMIGNVSTIITALPLPPLMGGNAAVRAPDGSASNIGGSHSATSLHGNRREDELQAGRFGNNLDFVAAGGNIAAAPPLLRGPGPRLLSLLWTVSAQLGWTANDVGNGAASVFLNRQLIIGLQWLSLTLMTAPSFWTLCARHVQWIPNKPVDYVLEGLPYGLTNEMRFLSENECGAAAFLLVVGWLFFCRSTERLTSRDFFRAMLEHESPESSTTFHSRLFRRCMRQWDTICPLFLQRLIYTPEWNRRSVGQLMQHVAFWRNSDFREHRSVFTANAGRGLMFWGGRWKEIDVKSSSSRNILFALVVSLGSFLASAPNFWMNILTVFTCSISLGLSMSLRSVETETSGTTIMTNGAGALRSLNLPSVVTGSFLIGQLLGSSGGVLFLAEFVVTSISFILGGAGTISASSVESWGCFFCLSCTAFWGYLFGRIAVMDAIIRQKRQLKNSGCSSFLLCTSLAVVMVLWMLMFLWRWDVPVSLMIVRPNFWKGARSSGSAASTETAARSAARKYAAKHLQ